MLPCADDYEIGRLLHIFLSGSIHEIQVAVFKNYNYL